MQEEQVLYIKTGNVVRRQIADEIILVPVRKSAEDLDSIYSVNQMAATVWEMLDGKRTLGQIRDALLQEYEVSPAELEKDLLELLEQLKSENLIREV